MSFAQILEELPSLTSEERQLIIERASALEGDLFSPEDEALIEKRLVEHERDPSTAISAEEMLARLHGRYAK